MHNNPEELHNFAMAAKKFHEKNDETDLLENMTSLKEIIAQESMGNSSEIEASIQRGILSKRIQRSI